MKDRGNQGGTTFRRRVFYIPGYDPFHPRRYRELYRTEGAAQAAISGYDLTLQPRAKGSGPFGWQVRTAMDGGAAIAAVEVLVWSDLVQASMRGGIGATYLALLRTAWVYVGSGALFRLMRLRKGPVIAALYPVAMLIAQLLVCLLAGWVAGEGVARAVPSVGGRVLAWCVALGLIAVGLRWFRGQDHRFFAYYLMQDYAYSAVRRGAYPAGLEARMAGFRTTVAQALDQDWDEVLVVGHSSGAHLGVSILADLIRGGLPPLSENGCRPALAFLSLGQVVPMVSFLPDAHRLRADLHYLSARDELAWVDVTAPGDGCAFALCDPVSVSGVAPPAKRWPLVMSAAFTQTLSPERWRDLRWRFFRLHFQYLCAFDRPHDYDYFRITAGGVTLADRYANRAPSKSRIERAVSRHTSMVA